MYQLASTSTLRIMRSSRGQFPLHTPTREVPLNWLTRKGVAPEGSLSHRFRARRWQEFVQRFPGIEDMTVLDLGGTAEAWSVAPAMPERLVLLNVQPQRSSFPGMETIVGDACSPPADIRSRHF